MPPRHKPSKVAKFIDDFQTKLNPARLFQPKPKPAIPRSIFINQDLPSEFRDKKGHVPKDLRYTASQVVTSKYTIITFVPRNLLEQVSSVPLVRLLSDVQGGSSEAELPLRSTFTDVLSFRLAVLPLMWPSSSVGSPTSSSSVRPVCLPSRLRRQLALAGGRAGQERSD